MANKLLIERESGNLSISYSWKTPGMWFLAFFSVIWDLFIVFFLMTGAGLFISLHLLAGIFITWYTITRFTNRTKITIDREKLLIDNGPIPWPFAKNQRIPARSLVQLFVSKSGVKVNDQPTFNLKAKLDTGVEVALIKTELDKQLLLDLERTIETYLDIKNDTSLDLSGKEGFENLDLEEMKAQLEQMQKLKKWLPGSIVKQMELAEEKILQEANGRGGSASGSSRSSGTSGGGSGSSAKDDGFFARKDLSGPRPLPTPTHNFVYPLYHAKEGDAFTYLGKTYRLGRSAQIDWEDKHITVGRQLEAIPGGGGDQTHFYAQNERERWAYFEERRLDDAEVEVLGFKNEVHPLRFDNGKERYYPRDEQRGKRFVGRVGEPVQQFIYFTTASGTQFRALKPEGRGWEVYVMEVVDGGSFDKV
ncbi:hypothetical protein [Neolewinella persica]|uniref:hypothetical protein n=1 Tax=Neolewinella persica TaxID=70998 RepID=UPI0003A36BC1|nr:hypothetical protein [Neolewinella persica]